MRRGAAATGVGSALTAIYRPVDRAFVWQGVAA